MDLADLSLRKTNITIGTETYEFSELLIGDIADFRARLLQKHEEQKAKKRAEIIEDAKSLGNYDTTKMIEEINKIPDLTEQDIDRKLSEDDSLFYLAWLSLRRSRPSITYEDVCNRIPVSKMPEISRALLPRPTAKDLDAEKKTENNLAGTTQ